MKGFGNFTEMLREAQKQAQKLQKQMEQVQQELKERVVEASAGGGMVTVHMNGRQELLSIKIDPEVVDPKEVDMLEDLVVAAVNQAIKKSQQMYEEEMGKLTGGMLPPGMMPFGGKP